MRFPACTLTWNGPGRPETKVFWFFFSKKNSFLKPGTKFVDVLQAWQQASALVLSCPGPLRRHPASLLPLAELTLPQCFLGGESQLIAFAAAVPAGMRQKMLFAPLPEIFSGLHGLDAAFRALGRTPPGAGQIIHLRFGSVRDARVLKSVSNVAVLAERAAAPPLTASHHPFASGTSLPAAMQGVFLYGPDGVCPRRAGGEALPRADLSAPFVTADLAAKSSKPAGLDLMSLADFDSEAWAAGAVRAPKSATRGGGILVPWNLAHFGSIVPDLLIRLAILWEPGLKIPPLVLLPFNYLGQTGLLRQLIARLREEAPKAVALLSQMSFARVTNLGGLVPLRKIARAAWVDGNDPEAWWSLARLQASGFDPILIDPSDAPDTNTPCVAAEESIWVESDTRYGKLTFDSRLPALRALPKLLAMSASPARR
jgi:hypothetical protein